MPFPVGTVEEALRSAVQPGWGGHGCRVPVSFVGVVQAVSTVSRRVYTRVAVCPHCGMATEVRLGGTRKIS